MINQEILEELYSGLGVEVFRLYTVPRDEADLLTNYVPSKLWRMNNLYTIIDKSGDKIPFVMNLSQHKVYAASLEWYRLIILKSRQQGISTFWLLNFLDSAIFIGDTSVGLMAQGKEEASKLLKRVKLAWREFDHDLKVALGGLSIDVDKAGEIGLNNGSSIYISVSFRSATLQGLHVSELGKIANDFPKRARELKTGSLQTIKPGMPVAIESTAEGDNMFKVMWDVAYEMEECGLSRGPKDFKPVFLSWLWDLDCLSDNDEEITTETAEYFERVEEDLDTTMTKQQKNFWVGQQRELGDDIYQEYPSTPTEAFIAVKDGTYYARLYMKLVAKLNREVKGLYDPVLSVQVAMDLGMNDAFVLVYFQRWGEEVRIIAEYKNSGREIKHYVDHMFRTPYTITNVYMPHDGAVRELITGKRRSAYMRELGVTGLKLLPKTPVADGIDLVRRMMRNLWVDKSCVYVISCFKSYTKVWDEEYNVWQSKPRHDDASHGADTLRIIATAPKVQSRVLGVVDKATGSSDVTDGLGL